MHSVNVCNEQGAVLGVKPSVNVQVTRAITGCDAVIGDVVGQPLRERGGSLGFMWTLDGQSTLERSDKD